MRFRLSRSRFGSLIVASALAGCAVPPPAQQADNGLAALTTGTPVAQSGGSLLAPQSYGAAFGTPPASAEPATSADETVAANAPDVSSFRQTGRASWYAFRFHGRRTASGERYDSNALTAAHRTLPLGSYVKVTVPGTVKSIVVKINDRGPFVRSRVIDLSFAAAKALGLDHKGTATVQIEGLSTQEAREARAQTYASNGSSEH